MSRVVWDKPGPIPHGEHMWNEEKEKPAPQWREGGEYRLHGKPFTREQFAYLADHGWVNFFEPRPLFERINDEKPDKFGWYILITHECAEYLRSQGFHIE